MSLVRCSCGAYFNPYLCPVCEEERTAKDLFEARSALIEEGMKVNRLLTAIQEYAEAVKLWATLSVVTPEMLIMRERAQDKLLALSVNPEAPKRQLRIEQSFVDLP